MVALSQIDMFGGEAVEKSYRAIRHDIVRSRQSSQCATAHHPAQKQSQIHRVLEGQSNLTILELFAGEGGGGCTEAFGHYGAPVLFDKRLGTGDSFRVFHRLIAEGRLFDVVDLDPYGFPTRFMPDVFLLLEDGVLFVTCPIPAINILHDITKTHLFAYFGDDNPSIERIIERFCLAGLCHWREVSLIDCIKFDRMYRIALRVKRVKATEYAEVRNR